jgi:hypothetical protein
MSVPGGCAKRPAKRGVSEWIWLAHWMIENNFATGHGDTFEDLLAELTWQVAELRRKLWT